MKMLFAGGDPRNDYALAADEAEEKALRATGYLPLDESGQHPDQYRDALPVADEVFATIVDESQAVASEPTPAVIKRGPGRPKKA